MGVSSFGGKDLRWIVKPEKGIHLFIYIITSKASAVIGPLVVMVECGPHANTITIHYCNKTRVIGCVDGGEVGRGRANTYITLSARVYLCMRNDVSW
jgi:hypothetical protein